MSIVMPGVCRHCRCTESNACRLEDGDSCCWMDRTRTVCSNPSCQRAEADRVKKARAAAAALTPKRMTPAEVHAAIRGRGRRKKASAA